MHRDDTQDTHVIGDFPVLMWVIGKHPRLCLKCNRDLKRCVERAKLTYFPYFRALEESEQGNGPFQGHHNGPFQGHHFLMIDICMPSFAIGSILTASARGVGTRKRPFSGPSQRPFSGPLLSHD
ncbi:hypothetical protein PoB_002409500 [Plakobranchus ocellatus]|uniref:Uncharacterized protein n=1 Tax=Plakobranchus ocellatus TaxID=259542 RepID=A0AAV3ZR26_9GAST|nr:hypothetical protein PoB_002409500 [Plakobranchus ocellatus]